jgi:hypothetical protein
LLLIMGWPGCFAAKYGSGDRSLCASAASVRATRNINEANKRTGFIFLHL